MHSTIIPGRTSNDIVTGKLTRMFAPRPGTNGVDDRWDVRGGSCCTPDRSLLTLDNFAVTCSRDSIFQLEVGFQLQSFRQVSVKQSNHQAVPDHLVAERAILAVFSK